MRKRYFQQEKFKNITLELARLLLVYDPYSGELIWQQSRGSTVKPGDFAQKVQMSLLGVKIPTTHVIWFVHYGYWPEPGDVIDHIDRNNHNNILKNLRCCSQQVNTAHELLKDSEEGIHFLTSGDYAVNVFVGSQMMVVGVYKNQAEADMVLKAIETYRRIYEI